MNRHASAPVIVLSAVLASGCAAAPPAPPAPAGAALLMVALGGYERVFGLLAAALMVAGLGVVATRGEHSERDEMR